MENDLVGTGVCRLWFRRSASWSWCGWPADGNDIPSTAASASSLVPLADGSACWMSWRPGAAGASL